MQSILLELDCGGRRPGKNKKKMPGGYDSNSDKTL